MLFGAHVSAAGGIQNAPVNAGAIGCEVFQIFSRSPQGGPAPKLTPDIVKAFRENCDANAQQAWYIHTPYYINLASASPALRASSVRIIREELERGSLIGARAVMSHMGSAKDNGSEAGALKLVIAGVKKILEGYGGTTKFLVEISAGAGRVIGDTFEEIGAIVCATKGRVGVCFDTQHAFGSGYDLRTPEAVRKTFDAFEKLIGMEHLYASHCNDSMVPLGSHKDRHAHIGKGEIGLDGFKALFAEKRLADVHYLLETRPDGQADDLKTMKKLRAAEQRR